MEKDLDNLLSKPASYYKNLILKDNPKFYFKKPVILFGAAKLGIAFQGLCKKNNIKILCFCDNDISKKGKHINNIIVYSPKDIYRIYSKNTQILITSLYDEVIKKQLDRLGFTHIWSHEYFSTLYAKKFPILSWSNDIKDIINNKDKIVHCYRLLKDSHSKRVFIGILKYRLTLDRWYLNGIADNQQKIYFDKDIILLKKKEIFLDGGAYNGDTIKTFIKATHNVFEKAYCFEPDNQSFRILKIYVQKTIKDSRIKVLRYGLGQKKGIVHFTGEGNLQSQVSQSGKNIIQIVPVDKYMNEKFTFIKLDIEGYEKDALLGAKETMKCHKPKLAICAYHYLNDLWEIPLLIKKINPFYNLCLRHYNRYLFDTIYYAI